MVGCVLDKERVCWLAWLWKSSNRALYRGRRAGLSWAWFVGH